MISPPASRMTRFASRKRVDSEVRRRRPRPNGTRRDVIVATRGMGVLEAGVDRWVIEPMVRAGSARTLGPSGPTAIGPRSGSFPARGPFRGRYVAMDAASHGDPATI